MPTRCPACGHLPGDAPHALSPAERLFRYAVELTRASTAPGELPQDVGARLRFLHAALTGLEDGEGGARS